MPPDRLPPPAPECAKLAKISDKSQLIGEFLDWLLHEKRAWITVEQHHQWQVPCVVDQQLWKEALQVRRETGGGGKLTPHPPSCQCGGSGERTKTSTEDVQLSNIQRLLAEYFEIDLDLVDQERVTLLEYLRRQNDQQENAS